MHKKILILANSASGLCSFRLELVTRLVAEGYRVLVSVPVDPCVPDIEAAGATVLPILIERRGTNPLKDLQLLWRYYRLLRRERPDAVLTYTIKPNVYGGWAASLLRIPYLANITGLGSAVENPGLLQQLTVAMYRVAMRRASCIFFQNRGNEAFFAQRQIRNAVHRVIPGSGVNLEKFTLRPYPAESQPLQFVFISRLMREKGIEDYFAVARHFKARYPDMQFHILGRCEEAYEATLKALHDQGIVQYHGQQKDVRPFIEQAHCTIHPTFYPEGMSNVVLESAALGRPVITTQRHGCMEAVDDGLTGYLFPERQTEALIACVERFIALPYAAKVHMGQAAHDKMAREFNRLIVVEAYLQELQKLHV